MGRPTTLLEGLCGHARSFGAQSIVVEHKDGREWVFANKDGIRIGIANYKSSNSDGEELRGNLYAAATKPVRTVIGGQVHILKVRVFESFERYFRVSPPSVHEMIKTLERNGLIERTPGQARSIRLCVKAENLPRLI
jgi:hypothetical protein